MEAITIIVRYKVRKKKLAKVKKALAEFIDNVQKKEPGIASYQVFQESDDPTSFVHVMSFADKKVEKAHSKSEHVKRFVKVLQQSCKQQPDFTSLRAVKHNKPSSPGLKQSEEEQTPKEPAQ